MFFYKTISLQDRLIHLSTTFHNYNNWIFQTICLVAVYHILHLTYRNYNTCHFFQTNSQVLLWFFIKTLYWANVLSLWGLLSIYLKELKPPYLQSFSYSKQNISNYLINNLYLWILLYRSRGIVSLIFIKQISSRIVRIYLIRSVYFLNL